MSTRIMASCWPLRMPSSPKSVLISLADNANDHGECWPSLAHICQRTCLGKTAVIGAIKWLESKGLLVADRTNGRHSRYVIQVQDGGTVEAKPVCEANRSASRTGASGGTDQCARQTAPVRQADTNHQEPSRTEKQKQPKAALADPPCWIDKDAWIGFVEMRRRVRFPLTQRAADLVIRELEKLRDQFDPAEVLDQSTRNGWRDVFPIRDSGGLRTGVVQRAAQPSKTLTGLKALQEMKA